jgi:hypothetical protein
MKHLLTKKVAISLVIVLGVLLNLSVFCFAYPQIFAPQSDTLARDFSAYYMGSWRLFHNPSAVYFDGSQVGDYPILGQPQPFKYTPNFLLMFLPFMALSYQDAFSAFDIVQFLLIPLLGFFVYKLVKEKNIFLAPIVAMIVLVEPILFTPSISYDPLNFLHWRIYSLQIQTFSPSYYCGYLLGNAHILQNVLLVGALYFGYARKPWLSALMFTFGAFDPRCALFAVPLLLWYNRQSLKKFVGGTAVLLAATTLPFFLYNGVGFAFLDSVFHASVVSQMYLYDWIPLYAIGVLTAAELVTVVYERKLYRGLGRGLKTQKP